MARSFTFGQQHVSLRTLGAPANRRSRADSARSGKSGTQRCSECNRGPCGCPCPAGNFHTFFVRKSPLCGGPVGRTFHLNDHHGKAGECTLRADCAAGLCKTEGRDQAGQNATGTHAAKSVMSGKLAEWLMEKLDSPVVDLTNLAALKTQVDFCCRSRIIPPTVLVVNGADKVPVEN